MTPAFIAESATKELQSVAEFMPNLADTDARTLALRLYYLELADGIPPVRAQNKVSQMFLLSAATVKRWSASGEATGEDALLDHRSVQDERDPSLLFARVIKLDLKRLKQGGKHKDGYGQFNNCRITSMMFFSTIQRLCHLNYWIFMKPDTTLVRYHELLFYDGFTSWAISGLIHKGLDRHEDQDFIAYHNEWVKKMLSLQSRLPILSEETGKPEWSNLPTGEKPSMQMNGTGLLGYAVMLTI